MIDKCNTLGNGCKRDLEAELAEKLSSNQRPSQHNLTNQVGGQLKCKHLCLLYSLAASSNTQNPYGFVESHGLGISGCNIIPQIVHCTFEKKLQFFKCLSFLLAASNSKQLLTKITEIKFAVKSYF